MFKAYAIICNEKLAADGDYYPYIVLHDSEGLAELEDALAQLELHFPEEEFKIVAIGELSDA